MGLVKLFFNPSGHLVMPYCHVFSILRFNQPRTSNLVQSNRNLLLRLLLSILFELYFYFYFFVFTSETRAFAYIRFNFRNFARSNDLKLFDVFLAFDRLKDFQGSFQKLFCNELFVLGTRHMTLILSRDARILRLFFFFIILYFFL